MSRSFHFVALVLLLTAAPLFAASDTSLCLWYQQTGGRVGRRFPVGSGRLGAMVFGGLPDERIQFNEDTLWTGQPHNYDRAGAGNVLPEIRQLVFTSKVNEAADLARKKFLSDPVRQKAYQPFGDIRLHFPGQIVVSNYRRELDLNTAIARTSYSLAGVSYQREVFASYPDNVIVIHLTVDQPGALNFTVAMDSPHKISQTTAISADTLKMTGQVRDLVAPFESGHAFRVPPARNKHRRPDRDHRQQHRHQNADAVTLLLVAATSFRNFQDISADPAQRCEAMFSKLKDKSYESLREAHITDFRSLFGRVTLDLGHTDISDLPTDQRLKRIVASADTGNKSKDAPAPASLGSSGLDSDPALAALFFQYGRYMLISSSRPGTPAVKPPRRLERTAQSPMGKQIHHQHQCRDELLARRSDQPQRMLPARCST